MPSFLLSRPFRGLISVLVLILVQVQLGPAMLASSGSESSQAVDDIAHHCPQQAPEGSPSADSDQGPTAGCHLQGPCCCGLAHAPARALLVPLHAAMVSAATGPGRYRFDPERDHRPPIGV
jgi:hypothetical protein